MQSMTTNETSPARPGAAGEGGPGSGPVSGRELRELLADDAWLDELIDRADEGGVRLTGEGGFLAELVKAVLERGLATELSDHLGYDKGDPAGRGSPNTIVQMFTAVPRWCGIRSRRR
jgi:putative transposase